MFEDFANPPKGKGKETEGKKQSPLPFPVLKRSAVATAGNKAGTPATPAGLSEPPISGAASRAGILGRPRSPAGIAELSEMVSTLGLYSRTKLTCRIGVYRPLISPTS